MKTRIQLNSKVYTVDVYKHMPSAQENKRYALQVERLTIPPMSGGLIFNQPLFTVERRLVVDREHSVIDPYDESVTKNAIVNLHIPSTFTPANVRTTSELIYQMNVFFRKLLLSLVTSTDDFTAGAGVYYVPDIFEEEKYDDWYAFQNTDDGIPVQSALEAIYRSDGRIGIKFSTEAIPMFVINLTSEGKRILGWGMDYLFVDVNNDFKEEYLTWEVGGLPNNLDDHYNVTSNVPANPKSVIGTFNNNIFNHGHYRHEIVITTSLPLRTYLECDHRSALFKHQLASYRYPNEPIITQYDGTLYRVLKHERRNRYMFEQSTRTHNVFLLTGTQLQNFHIRLMQRNYEWVDDLQQFKICEEPYKLPEESLWTMQLLITPLQD